VNKRLPKPFAAEVRDRALLLSAAGAHAISEGGTLVLGAQAGEARLREVFQKAGFTHFRRAAETPFNLIFEARR
jgi:hypothetical protein